MPDRRPRMLVIGAGPVGLCMAKSLRQRGIAYDQVDADDDVGGNWKHGVYDSAHIISSKKTTQYSDFPMPADYPDFPSRLQILDYLRSYTEHFQLRSTIEFRTKVLRCQPIRAEGVEEIWQVDLDNGERRIYKGVVVCNGHHWERRWPTIAGEFTGDYLHSKDYKRAEQLEGKRVLVIGGGNSACDVASEAARVGQSCHLSLRRGFWILPKTFCGIPIVEVLPGWLPIWAQRLCLRTIVRLVFGRHEKYGLPHPDHRLFEAHPTINGELLNYIQQGRILPKCDVARFEGKTVHFTDGSQQEFDAVVCATGFYVRFPFLPPDLVPVRNDQQAQLYGGICVPDYKHLYVVGTSQPRYGFGPLITLGGELIARIIQLQDEMVLPFGRLLKELGYTPASTHLQCPHAALREIRLGLRTIPYLRFRERLLRRKFGKSAPPPTVPECPTVDPQLSVY